MDVVLNPCEGTQDLLRRIESLNVQGNHQYIGDYRVKRTLGKGTFGVVKLCVDKEGHDVAVKVVSKGDLQRNDVQRARTETEIKILKAVSHPYVCTLRSVEECNGLQLIVMDHMEGGELYDVLLKEGCLSSEDVALYFAQAHCAVVYLHRQGIYHRDIKLENLLLDGKLRVKLCDFGFAWRSATKGERTATNCGSPHYAAPEVVRNEVHVPVVAEVWSLGVLLYALATACLPFDGPTPEATLQRIVAGDVAYPEDLPSALRSLLAEMFVVSPARRIPLLDIGHHAWYRQKLLRLPIDVKQEVEKQLR